MGACSLSFENSDLLVCLILKNRSHMSYFCCLFHFFDFFDPFDSAGL